MDILSTIFWVIVITIWIISALARKRAGTSPEEQPPAEGEGHRRPEEALENFLRRISGEEEIQIVPPMAKRAIPPSPWIEEKEVVLPQVKTRAKVEEPVYEIKLPEKKEAVRSPLPGILNISTIRQGIILSEILGPPRAQRPL